VEKLKIYLGDLTYNTIALSTEAFPLNIGFIASYCKKLFGSAVDITLFKYVEDLDKAINENPPDILGLSNYCWNQRVDTEMFKILLNANPNALTVWGGPNFPLDLPTQEEFLNQNKEVDIYVPIDGEVGFSNIVDAALQCNSKEEIKEKIQCQPIDGCASIDSKGKLQYSIPVIRIRELDEIPSPYTNGFLDKFFDGKLSPMTQTNRGCPFSCTFCTDGKDEVNQVNNFSMERVKEDIEYIASKAPKTIHTLMFSDLNFGMFPRDLEICSFVSNMQKKYGFPERVHATTGKNQKEKIINAIKQLDGSLRIQMSVQSMDEQVLSNIRRANISSGHLMALAPAIKEAKLNTLAEVILGLPGESYASHTETIRALVRAKMDSIYIYTCMMLPGSELNTPIERKKWGLKTKFRILPRDFAKLSNGRKVIEIEEVSIGSNVLSFDEYVELRQLAFSLMVTNVGIVYDALLRFLRENNVDVFKLFFRTMKQTSNAPSSIKDAFEHFKQATINELWDTSEEIIEHYQNDDEFQKLLDGVDGINVVQYHHAIVTVEHMDDWTKYILQIAHDLLIENKSLNGEVEKQFNEISNYCKGISFNPLAENRMSTNPEFMFDYDIPQWVEDLTDSKLENFKFSIPTKIVFKLTEKQFNEVQDEFKLFGDNPTGQAQVVKSCYGNNLRIWRYPILS